MKVIRRAYEEALLKFGANDIGTWILLISVEIIVDRVLREWHRPELCNVNKSRNDKAMVRVWEDKK